MRGGINRTASNIRWGRSARDDSPDRIERTCFLFSDPPITRHGGNQDESDGEQRMRIGAGSPARKEVMTQ